MLVEKVSTDSIRVDRQSGEIETGIVPGKRRCHGRWYKGRAPSSTERRGNLLYAAAHIAADPWHFTFNFSFCALEARFLRLFLRQPTRARGKRVALSMTTQERERNARVNLFFSVFFFGGKITTALLLPAPIFHFDDESSRNFYYFSRLFFRFSSRGNLE